jgi:patatin-like phospholipase
MRLIGVLADGLYWLDDQLRFFDAGANRTRGGMLRPWTGRHTIVAIGLPVALVFLLVNGPSLRLSGRLLAAVVAAILSAWVFLKTLKFTSRGSILHDLIGHAGILLAVVVALWWVAGANAIEASDAVFYRHVFMPIVLLLVLTAVVSALLASRLFTSERARKTLTRRLPRVDLFVSRPTRQQPTLGMLLLAAFGALTSTPGRVLLFPSLVILFVDREWVTWVFVALLVVNLGLLAFANLDRRFSGSWQLLHITFFGGWVTLVSALVILLGIARILDVQYVSTIFDGARGHTIAGYVFAAYVFVWWHDYWTSTTAVIRFLDVLGGKGSSAHGQIAYPLEVAPTTRVPADNRVIQSHGAGRVVVWRDDDGGKPFFHAYKPEDLVDALIDDLPENDPGRPDADWVKWRLNSHFLITSAVLTVIFVSAGWALSRLPQQPSIPSAAARSTLSVSSVLFAEDACTSGTPVIALAASGGGTRAALYTASILERLQRQGLLGSVRLISGVSGGGAALAYFAAHRAALLKGDQSAWDAFFTAMQQPYIADVLDGSGEFRIAATSRLGVLLAESFERYWSSPRKTMGEVQDIGLMLNSSIAGRFVVVEPNPEKSSLGLLERRAQSGRTASGTQRRGNSGPFNARLSDVTGGRVVYTNLDLPDHVGAATLIEHQPTRDRNDTRLPVFILNGRDITLAAAAAANANFPPVFSNAPVDRDENTRFWVTDGGAVDNRGTESLLMAIRYALITDGERCATLPPLHVVEVEASAFSDGYRQDRGIGSMMSAGTAFASQLDAELMSDIREIYQRRVKDGTAAVRFHYLPMPALLRRSGSFGTHWMLQPTITVCKDPDCRESMALTGTEVVTLLRALNHHRLPSDEDTQADEAQKFIEKEDLELVPNWNRLTACLRSLNEGC